VQFTSKGSKWHLPPPLQVRTRLAPTLANANGKKKSKCAPLPALADLSAAMPGAVPVPVIDCAGNRRLFGSLSRRLVRAIYVLAINEAGELHLCASTYWLTAGQLRASKCQQRSARSWV
jgi:hypothetical protein